MRYLSLAHKLSFAVSGLGTGDEPIQQMLCSPLPEYYNGPLNDWNMLI